MKGNIFTTKLHKLILEEDTLFLVMNYFAGDLRQLFYDEKPSNFEFGETHLKVILYNILCSLQYLHSANVIHRDIKPANILVDECCNVAICDFGLSRTLGKKKRPMTTRVVSRWYRPPEIILDQN